MVYFYKRRMAMETVVLVDNHDLKCGVLEKLAAHEQGLLHRAVSGFVINEKKEMLLQQRALCKYHTPGIWSNTVCSHPREGESVLAAVTRRLSEEMGMTANFKEVGHIIYKVSFSNGLIEHEYDHVFVAKYDGQDINPNPEEVASYRWISRNDLISEIKQYPEKFSPWMQLIIQQDFMKEYF